MLRKAIKISIVFALSFFMFSCTGATTHPVVKQRNAIKATEIRINLYVADNITQGRIDNYPLEQGNNYLKVPAGTHILYWNKDGVNHSREITISSQNNKFILF